jgi:hypothetical protein
MHPKQWRVGERPWAAGRTFPAADARVIIDNDFSGDPDDLYQLVHHLLSPSVETRLVIGSHLRFGSPSDPGPDTAYNASLVARDVFARMGLASADIVVQGSPIAMVDTETPQDTPAARAIIAEANRADSRPLFYAAGGGLTDLASAILLAPEIASKIILVWIGGSEHAEFAVPPKDAWPIEYNLWIDIPSVQVCFDNQDLEIWQIPRNVYRQCLVSETELYHRVATKGALGKYLFDEIEYEMNRVGLAGREVFESYPMGDSPLVLLTALRSIVQPDSSSSPYAIRPKPAITTDGAYRALHGTIPMRVYQQVDVRLMFEDFFYKLEEFTQWQDS